MADVTEEAPIPVVSWWDFLRSVPPGVLCHVFDAAEPRAPANLTRSEVEFYCSQCEAEQPARWDHKGWPQIQSKSQSSPQGLLLPWVCNKCSFTLKVVWLALWNDSPIDPDSPTHALKFGEWPHFRQRVSNHLRILLGPEFPLWQKGVEAESLGHGIGAFAYYRRIVEDRKNKMLERARNVAEQSGETGIIAVLDAAIAEQQFSNAVSMVKEAIPRSLLIKTHNPFTLLHGALSEGLHAKTDEECLRIAHSVRVILSEFADRVATALKDDAELNAALAMLMAKQQQGRP